MGMFMTQWLDCHNLWTIWHIIGYASASGDVWRNK